MAEREQVRRLKEIHKASILSKPNVVGAVAPSSSGLAR